MHLSQRLMSSVPSLVPSSVLFLNANALSSHPKHSASQVLACFSRRIAVILESVAYNNALLLYACRGGIPGITLVAVTASL